MKKSQLSYAASFLRNTSASMAMTFAVAIPALMGAAGIAVDFSIFNLKLTKLQGAADQAAIAAVKELSVVNTSKSSVTEVANGFVKSALANASVTVDVQIGVKNDSVKVTVTEIWTPFFAHFIGANVTPVVAGATAKFAGMANVCVLALNPVDGNAVRMDKQAKLLAKGCGIYSNSNSSQSIRLDSDSEMSAALICAVGGVNAKATAINPAPTTDCPVLPDPLSSRAAPTVGACKATALVVKNGSMVLDPGNYCGGLKITGTANVTFRPGDYVISDGVFEVSKDATVTSDNAAFYLKGEATTLNFTGNTTIDLTGANSGNMAGLLFFEDRSVSLGRMHRINSANARRLTGTIYMANGKLRIDPNSSVAQDSAYTAIIARNIEIDEGPTLVLNSDYGASNVPVPDGIRIGSQVVLSE